MRPLHAIILVSALLPVCAAIHAASALAPGTRVEASPQQMEQFWEPCVVESGPNQWDQYRLECAGYVLPVPSKWIREPRTPVTTAVAAAPPPSAPSQVPAASSTPEPGHARPERVAAGSYECWAFSSARMDLNFEITAPGRYTEAADGSSGGYSHDPDSGSIRFDGYLGEAMPEGFTAVYHENNGRPTVSFRGRSGAEASFCERM